MRTMIAMCLVFIAADSVSAQEVDCSRYGSERPIRIIDWSSENITDTFNLKSAKVTLKLRNELEDGVRLIAATAHFKDVLGEHIAYFDLARDVNVMAGGDFIYTGNFPGTSLMRLAVMSRDDVVAFACTSAVVYEDGTNESFK